MQKVLCSGSMSLVEICLAWELGSVGFPLRHSIAWLTGVFFPSAGFDHWIFHFDGQLQHFSQFEREAPSLTHHCGRSEASYGALVSPRSGEEGEIKLRS